MAHRKVGGRLPTHPAWHVYPATAFSDFAGRWDALNDSVQGPPLLSSAYITRLLGTFARGDELLAVKIRGGSDEVMAILCRHSTAVWATFQPPQMPIGAWLMRANLSYAQGADGLLASLPGWPLVLGIHNQDPDLYARPVNGPCIEVADYKRIGWLPVEGTFADYWQARPKKFRQNWRTQQSRLASLGITPTLERLTRAEDVAAALVEYGDLESAGWKGPAGTAISVANDQGRFYSGVLEEFCSVGKCVVYRLRFGERVAAIDLCLAYRDRLLLLKTTYDESLQEFSPSTQLKYLAYCGVFGEGTIHRIEFFGPFMEWTSRWTDQSRMLFHVTVLRYPGVRGLRALAQLLRPSR